MRAVTTIFGATTRRTLGLLAIAALVGSCGGDLTADSTSTTSRRTTSTTPVTTASTTSTTAPKLTAPPTSTTTTALPADTTSPAVSTSGDVPASDAPAPQPAPSDPVVTQAPTPEPPVTASPTPSPVPPPTAAPTPQPAPPATTAAPTVTGYDYVFPVQPARRASYVRDHHDYPATDIFARCGSDVVAPVAGTILEVSTVDTYDAATDVAAVRGGLSYSLAGDDGVRYYGSHLSRVDVGAGTRLNAGGHIGLVGDTGNAKGVGCHLHFGISRQCGVGDWQVRRGEIWPWPYLDSWKAGRNKSPKAKIASLPPC